MMRTFVICAALAASAASAQNLPDWATQFKQDVAHCWNVGASPEPLPALIVSLDMTPDAMPVADSFRMMGATQASDAAIETAFSAVRRAVIRCAGTGYDLPENNYDAWRSIIITFDPSDVDQR